jgi:hypothetical protein
MKVGSYVYNVNKIIFNMLFENESYQKLIDRWRNASSYFSVFVSIAVKIIEGIQWLLKKLYAVVNKNYMALSREMEFHADAVASTVAGGNNLVTALSSIQLADSCYNAALNNANGWIKEKKQTKKSITRQLKKKKKPIRMPTAKPGIMDLKTFLQFFFLVLDTTSVKDSSLSSSSTIAQKIDSRHSLFLIGINPMLNVFIPLPILLLNRQIMSNIGI